MKKKRQEGISTGEISYKSGYHAFSLLQDGNVIVEAHHKETIDYLKECREKRLVDERGK